MRAAGGPRAATIERDGYHLQSLVAGDFFYPAAVLDVRAEAKEDPDFALGVAEITS